MKTSIIIFVILLFSLQISAQIKVDTQKADTIKASNNRTLKKKNKIKSNYKTPGVYVEEISTLPSSIAEVATAIPAFIGITQIVPEDGEFVPVKINSMLEYEEHFGSFIPYQYNVKVKRNANSNALELVDLGKDSTAERIIMFYALKLYFSNGGGPCYILPLSKDANKDNYISGLKAVGKIDEVTLLVCPDAAYLKSGYYDVCNATLIQCDKLKDRFAILDVLMINNKPDDSGFRNNILGELQYGAAYTPFLNTSINYGYDEEKVGVNFIDTNNLIVSGSIKLNSLKKSNTEVYNFIKSELEKPNVILPPSAAIAGIYAQVDRDRGVWKSPANVAINGVIGPVYSINQNEQEDLNIDATSGKSINAIRSFSGKGTLVWGSRTLAGNDNEWRYISVRRLFNMIEESAQKSTEFVVFEANETATWIKVKAMLENYLFGLWQQGALAGSTPEKAYFVKIGLGQTMTSQDILEGRMVVEIGIAAVRPAEFIILRFSHKTNEP